MTAKVPADIHAAFAVWNDVNVITFFNIMIVLYGSITYSGKTGGWHDISVV